MLDTLDVDRTLTAAGIEPAHADAITAAVRAGRRVRRLRHAGVKSASLRLSLTWRFDGAMRVAASGRDSRRRDRRGRRHPADARIGEDAMTDTAIVWDLDAGRPRHPDAGRPRPRRVRPRRRPQPEHATHTHICAPSGSGSPPGASRQRPRCEPPGLAGHRGGLPDQPRHGREDGHRAPERRRHRSRPPRRRPARPDRYAHRPRTACGASPGSMRPIRTPPRARPPPSRATTRSASWRPPSARSRPAGESRAPSTPPSAPTSTPRSSRCCSVRGCAAAEVSALRWADVEPDSPLPARSAIRVRTVEDEPDRRPRRLPPDRQRLRRRPRCSPERHGPAAHGPSCPALAAPGLPPRAGPRHTRRTGRRERAQRPARHGNRTRPARRVDHRHPTGRRMERPADGRALRLSRQRRGWRGCALLRRLKPRRGGPPHPPRSEPKKASWVPPWWR